MKKLAGMLANKATAHSLYLQKMVLKLIQG
jgi:hypothetical protein